MSDLDNDFEKTAEQINEKIKQAAELLKEANALGKAAGMEYIGGSYYLMEDLSKDNIEKIKQLDFDPLLEQLDVAGWSSSSMMC